MAADSLASDSGTRIRETAVLLSRLFAHWPAGLFVDVDGTISRMTRRPMDATVTPEARETLRLLATRLDVISVITGRAVRRAQVMVGVAEIGYVGNHGLEWLAGDLVVTHPGAVAARPALDAALRAVRA